MSTTVATKTAQTIPTGMDWATATAADSAIVSADITCTTNMALAVCVTFARSGGSTFTAGKGPKVTVLVSDATSGIDNFYPIASRQMADGYLIANTTTNGAISADATSFVVTANTNITAGELIFVGDASAANYEAVQVRLISGTTIHIVGAFRYAHTTGALVTGQAEKPSPMQVDLGPFQRARIEVTSILSVQSFHFRVSYSTLDSLTTTT